MSWLVSNVCHASRLCALKHLCPALPPLQCSIFHTVDLRCSLENAQINRHTSSYPFYFYSDYESQFSYLHFKTKAKPYLREWYWQKNQNRNEDKPSLLFDFRKWCLNQGIYTGLYWWLQGWGWVLGCGGIRGQMKGGEGILQKDREKHRVLEVIYSRGAFHVENPHFNMSWVDTWYLNCSSPTCSLWNLDS